MIDMAIMTHEQAVRSQAVERYVLGELNEEQRAAFEGHYFECPACFEQIKLSGEFLRHAREVLNPEPEPGFLSAGWLGRLLGDFRRPATAFVTAMFLCALGIGTYQYAVIGKLKAPRVEARYTLSEASRGAAKVPQVSRDAALSLRMFVSRSSAYGSYRAQIVSASGKVKYSLQVVPDEEGLVMISLAADSLDAGKYSMVVFGISSDGAQTQVGQGSFELQFSN
jgi:hypothetical protein